MPTLIVFALVFVALGFLSWIVAARSFGRGRLLGGASGLLFGILFTGLGATSGALSVATHGYQRLTREETAAVLDVRPKDEHAFEATIYRPGQPSRTVHVHGDQVYVDARIVKWRPSLNLLGLHTAYELERLAGRYRSARRAREAPRTVYPLGEERYIDVVGLVGWIPLLGRIVDAEYGSATFVEVDEPRRLEVRVSTSGLLLREMSEDRMPQGFRDEP